MNTKILAKKRSRANVIGKIGNGKPSLVVACHTDTVLAGKGWKTDPFKAVIKNGRIYGRGAIDDKGPFAVSYLAVKQFLQKHPSFKGKLYLVALADEEDNNEYGIKYLLKKSFKADAGLIPDGGYLNQFVYGEKGCLQLKIESFGKQEHSALQENGKNAIENLADLTTTLKSQLKFTRYDHRFTPIKINVSKFHGGEIANISPAHAWAQTDIRFPYGLSSKQVLTAINKIIAEKFKSPQFKFKTSIIYATEPHVVIHQRLIDSFIAAAQKVSMPMKAITLAGNSVAKEFSQAGIPSIAHYPATEVSAHEPNEYLSISEALKTVQLYTAFLEKFFKVG